MAKALRESDKASEPNTEAAERDFDIRLLASVVEFVNAVDLAAIDALPRKDWERGSVPAAAAFNWVSAAIEEKAKHAKLPEAALSGWRWDPKTAVVRQCYNLAANFRPVARYFAGTDPKLRDSAFWKVVDSTLRFLPVYVRHRFVDGHAYRETVPILNDVVRCVTYALVILSEDRWGLRDSIRECPYQSRGETQPHLFFDPTRALATSSRQGKRKVYCCTAHSNADRQRRFHGRD